MVYFGERIKDRKSIKAVLPIEMTEEEAEKERVQAV